ncbi:MAG: hypothetical protein LBD23_00315, partial [Oscillospiraceae bacterium]|nr:hypothetical protein [Oscillospiraceae bacterium]
MRVVLCGVGGYGVEYARQLLGNNRGVSWVGAVDPYPERVDKIYTENADGLLWFKTLEEFYASNTADLCIVSSPIAFHCAQSILA